MAETPDLEEPKLTRMQKKHLRKKERWHVGLLALKAAKWIVRWSLMFIIVALIAFLIYQWQLPRAPGESVEVDIPAGTTLDGVSQILHEERVISSAFTFKLLAKYQGVEGDILPGEYRFRENMNPSAVLKLLSKGPEVSTVKVTIPEGFTVGQIADRLAKKTPFDGGEFLRLAEDFQGASEFAFLDSNPTPSLEGYLFPETYQVRKETDAEGLIEMLLHQFGEETAGLKWSLATKKGLTLHQVITLASLVEKEARQPDERPLMSAVIHNRLAKKMPLQIDATIQYVLPERKSRLTEADLKTRSPYNTYLNQGLPPGPISNPGRASIEAALEPAPVDYLYYVLTDDEGGHTFTNNYEDFLKAKRGAKANSIAP